MVDVNSNLSVISVSLLMANLFFFHLLEYLQVNGNRKGFSQRKEREETRRALTTQQGPDGGMTVMQTRRLQLSEMTKERSLRQDNNQTINNP